MRKINLIETVQDFLSGGDAPSDIRGKYHPEIIKKWVEMAWNNVVFQTYMEGKMHSDYSVLDAWARNYPLVITSNTVKLPFPPVQLPNNMGIRQVANGISNDYDPTNVYAFRDTNAEAVFSALEVGNTNISEKPWFYLEINNGSGINSHVLKLGNVPNTTVGVTVKLIVPLEQIGDYEVISIPGGKEDMIVKSVIEILRQKPQEDFINDNNAQQI